VRAAIFNEPRHITTGDRPDATIREPSDAIVRVVLACVCGSDLWYYRGDSPFETGPIGHEFIGVIEEVGADVSSLDRGDLVIAPFAFSDGTCPNCLGDAYAAMDERRAIKSLVRVGSIRWPRGMQTNFGVSHKATNSRSPRRAATARSVTRGRSGPCARAMTCTCVPPHVPGSGWHRAARTSGAGRGSPPAGSRGTWPSRMPAMMCSTRSMLLSREVRQTLRKHCGVDQRRGTPGDDAAAAAARGSVMERPEIRTGPILAIVLASYTMIVLDISIVITALPKIHATLGFSRVGLSWVQNAYLLAFGAPFWFFSTQFLQGVDGYSPVAAGLAFLPTTLVNFAAAMSIPRLTRRYGNATVLVAGLTISVLGMAWLSRLSTHSDYLTGIALPMALIGAGQGGVLGPLTAAGIAGVAAEDAGAAGGVTNVFHQIGGSLGLAILATVFAPPARPRCTGRHCSLTGSRLRSPSGRSCSLISLVARPRQRATDVRHRATRGHVVAGAAPGDVGARAGSARG
jgi:hypothetical protein